jgi:ribonuclease VapC
VTVLDASALLAYLRSEAGAEVVADALGDGAVISTVNLAEVLSRATDSGADPALRAQELTDRGVLGTAVTVEPFTEADAIETARLRPLTRSAGLSLGDRACLALAKRLATRTLTADSGWADVTHGVQVEQIRAAKPPSDPDGHDSGGEPPDSGTERADETL